MYEMTWTRWNARVKRNGLASRTHNGTINERRSNMGQEAGECVLFCRRFAGMESCSRMEAAYLLTGLLGIGVVLSAFGSFDLIPRFSCLFTWSSFRPIFWFSIISMSVVCFCLST